MSFLGKPYSIMPKQQLPLEGIKVVDFSRLLPGPWCTQTLGDLGADVIKVEQPGVGDPSRYNAPMLDRNSVYFHSINRNKKSVELDLNEPGDRARLDRLLSAADVVVETFRPGVAKKLAIDFDSVQRINPQIIYCSISGFGSSGPMAGVPGHDLSIQGMTGQLGMVKNGGVPSMPSFHAADYAGACYAAIAILSAIVRRTSTGSGAYLDISLYDSLLALSPISLAGALARSTGRAEAGELEVWGGNPRYSIYQTADGKAVTVVLLETKTWYRFCDLIGRSDLAVKESLAERHSVDPERGKAARAAIQEFCSRFSRDDLVEQMHKEGIPVCPIYASDEVLQSREAASRESIRTEQSENEGRVAQIVDPLARAGLSEPFRRMAPLLGEHNHTDIFGA
ncbi:MAG: CoA transferase [Rhizobiaceae bacterium]|nr:CoA transferase [Rhizobiaceae bacterium]